MISGTYRSLVNSFSESFYGFEDRSTSNPTPEDNQARINVPHDMYEFAGDILTLMTRWSWGSTTVYAGRNLSATPINHDAERWLIVRVISKIARAVLFVLFIPSHCLGVIAYEFSITRQILIADAGQKAPNIPITKVRFDEVFGGLPSAALSRMLDALSAASTPPSGKVNINSFATLSMDVDQDPIAVNFNYNFRFCGNGAVYMYRKSTQNGHEVVEIKVTKLPSNMLKHVYTLPVIPIVDLVEEANQTEASALLLQNCISIYPLDQGLPVSILQNEEIFSPTALAANPLVQTAETRTETTSIIPIDILRKLNNDTVNSIIEALQNEGIQNPTITVEHRDSKRPGTDVGPYLILRAGPIIVEFSEETYSFTSRNGTPGSGKRTSGSNLHEDLTELLSYAWICAD